MEVAVHFQGVRLGQTAGRGDQRRGRSESDLAGAIMEMHEKDKGSCLRTMGEFQDPFIALEVAAKMLEAMRKD